MNCFVSCYTGDMHFSVLGARVTMNSSMCVKHCVCQCVVHFLLCLVIYVDTQSSVVFGVCFTHTGTDSVPLTYIPKCTITNNKQY